MARKCPRCRGSKEIKGIGCMIKECPECKGVGYVKDKEPVKHTVVEPKEHKEAKPKGRPKKNESKSKKGDSK